LRANQLRLVSRVPIHIGKAFPGNAKSGKAPELGSTNKDDELTTFQTCGDETIAMQMVGLVAQKELPYTTFPGPMLTSFRKLVVASRLFHDLHGTYIAVV
jgi:hypothetical protein